MTHNKSVKRRFRLRALKAVMTSALALSAAAGAQLLTGAEVKALECDFASGGLVGCTYGPQWPGAPGSPIPPGPAPLGPANPATWLETNIHAASGIFYYPTDKDIWIRSGPTAGSGTIGWSWHDVNNSGTWLIPPDPHSVDTWNVDVDFNIQLQVPSTFEYVVIIDKGQGGAPHPPWNYWFEDVQLQSIISPVPPGGVPGTVVKTIWKANCTASTPGGTYDSCSRGALIGSITNNGLLSLPPIYDMLYIQDVATPNDSFINAYQNEFRQEVPGPLPILGVGAALGFSRRLRKRIKGTA
jgi:hypothetical protein